MKGNSFWHYDNTSFDDYPSNFKPTPAKWWLTLTVLYCWLTVTKRNPRGWKMMWRLSHLKSLQRSQMSVKVTVKKNFKWLKLLHYCTATLLHSYTATPLYRYTATLLQYQYNWESLNVYQLFAGCRMSSEQHCYLWRQLSVELRNVRVDDFTSSCRLSTQQMMQVQDPVFQ